MTALGGAGRSGVKELSVAGTADSSPASMDVRAVMTKRRGYYLGPIKGEDTARVLDEAIAWLARARNMGVGEAGDDLHLLMSLLGEAESRLEDSVGAEAAIGQSLRAIAEGIRQRIAAFIGNAQNLFVLDEVELYGAGFMDNRIALHIPTDADVAGLGRAAHLLEFSDGFVVCGRPLNARVRQEPERADDDCYQDGELAVFVHATSRINIIRPLRAGYADRTSRVPGT